MGGSRIYSSIKVKRLDRILAVGLNLASARRQRWRAAVRAAINAWGLPIQYLNPRSYSPVLTRLLMRHGVAHRVVSALRQAA